MLDDVGNDFRRVRDARRGVAGHDIGPRPSLLLDVVFHQGIADAHHDAALDLAFQGQGVDRPANVVRRDDLAHADLARSHVDFAQHGLGAETEGEVHVAAGAERPGLRRFVVVSHQHVFCIVFRRLARCKPHRVAADERLPTGGRGPAVRTVIGVAQQYADILHRHAEFLGRAGGQYARQILAHLGRRDADFSTRLVASPDLDLGAGLVRRAAAEAGALSIWRISRRSTSSASSSIPRTTGIFRCITSAS